MPSMATAAPTQMSPTRRCRVLEFADCDRSTGPVSLLSVTCSPLPSPASSHLDRPIEDIAAEPHQRRGVKKDNEKHQRQRNRDRSHPLAFLEFLVVVVVVASVRHHKSPNPDSCPPVTANTRCSISSTANSAVR